MDNVELSKKPEKISGGGGGGRGSNLNWTGITPKVVVVVEEEEEEEEAILVSHLPAQV